MHDYYYVPLERTSTYKLKQMRGLSDNAESGKKFDNNETRRQLSAIRGDELVGSLELTWC